MAYDRWVLDASMFKGVGEPMCFCPLNDEGIVVIGITVLADYPLGKFVGVIHEDGQEAVEKFCEEHKDLIDKLLQKRKDSRGHKLLTQLKNCIVKRQ